MRALFKTSLPLRWVVTSVAIRMGNHLPSLVFLTFCNDFFVTHGAANRLHNAAVFWGDGWQPVIGKLFPLLPGCSIHEHLLRADWVAD